MRLSILLVAGFVFTVIYLGSQAQTFNIGRVATEEELQGWDIPVDATGAELPPGQGTARQGAAIYSRECIMCHGPGGENGPYNELKGRLRTYPASTWDFINRTMPRSVENVAIQGKKLEPDEVYALTAYILFINGVIDDEEVMDRDTLPGVIIPMDGSIQSIQHGSH
jgi:cytochrome c